MNSSVEVADDEVHQMVSCPFNSAHRLLRHRMPYHIVRCRRSYHGPALVACAFNAMHLVRPETMDEHLEGCEDYLKNRPQAWEAERFEQDQEAQQAASATAEEVTTTDEEER